MKAKITKGSGFRGCLDYVTKAGAERIGGTLAGTNAREMSREFSVARRLREDIERPVWHTSLSLPKGERLDTERWNKACVAFLARMGIIPPEEVQWTAWRHTDGEYDHVHIVVNRISLTGAVWDAGLDVYKAIAATREIEKSFGLTITPGRENKKFAEPSLKRGEVEKAIREQRPPVKVRVSDALKLSLEGKEGKPDTETFVRRMEEYGIEVVPNIASTGRMNGFSFAVDGIAVRGSDVGAAWKYLREAIDYDVQRDSQLLLDLKKGRGTAGVKKDGGANRRNPNGYDLGIEAGRGEPEARNRSTDGSGVESRPEVGKGIVYPPTGIKRGSDSDGGELEETAPQPAMVRPFDASGVDEWTSLVGGIDEIARHQQSFVQADSTSRAVKEVQGWERLKRIKALPTESLQIKMGKVLDELGALDCPEYRITAVVPKDLTGGFDSKGKKLYSKNLCRESKDADEVFFKQGEEEKWLAAAEDFNDEQRDIYITPVDQQHYYLIVDDLNETKVQKMKRSGVTPCIVVESSQGNYHAIVKVPRTDAPGEKSAADRMVKELNARFDGDPNIAGCTHMFRVSGFQSKKPSRNGWRVRLAEVNPGAVCDVTSRRLREMMEEEHQKQTAETKPKERTAARIAADSSSFSDMERRYREEWETTRAVFQRKGWKEDWSQIDYKTAKTLLIEGYDPEDVARAMVSASPDVARRHPRTEEWARKVVESADRSIPDDLRPRYDGR